MPYADGFGDAGDYRCGSIGMKDIFSELLAIGFEKERSCDANQVVSIPL